MRNQTEPPVNWWLGFEAIPYIIECTKALKDGNVLLFTCTLIVMVSDKFHTNISKSDLNRQNDVIFSFLVDMAVCVDDHFAASLL